MIRLNSKKTTKPKELSTGKVRLKKGDTVIVIAGKDKGKTGIVKQVLIKSAQVVVEGINIRKKSIRPNPTYGIQGGITEISGPLHISNVMYYDLKTSQPTKIKITLIQEAPGSVKRVRVGKKTNEQLDI